MYVDDWLSGCDDDADGCAMLREADEVTGLAGMSLAKWSSNSEQVLLCREFQDFAGKSSKVLGICWLANQECFSFDGVTAPPSADAPREQAALCSRGLEGRH